MLLQKANITAIDVRKLSDSITIDNLKSQLKDEVVRDSVSDIQKAINEKKLEYELTPSILDTTVFEEPESDELTPTLEEKYLPWWHKLGLISDPFPEQEGLAAIAQDMHEKTVYKTDIFDKYLFLIRNSSEELFKNRIFFGQFGSGKTTLFDYLGKPLNNELIYNIYIQLYAEQDFQALITRFREKFFKGLCEIFETLYQSDPIHWLKSNNLQTNIFELTNKLVAKNDLKGLVVFIDDLHKNSDEIEVALKFINNLQIIRSELVRNNTDLNLAFYIAGHTDWQAILKNDPKFSGSYAKYELMPIISAEMAYEMLNKRLMAFAGNPEAIRKIDLRYVKKIYRALENSKGEPITFRSFIKKTLEQFEQYNFTILSADPIIIPPEKLRKIRDVFESDLILRKKMNNLLFAGGIQNNITRARTLNLLIQTYLDKGISDDSKVLVDNKFIFQRLAKSGLIQKTILSKRIKWFVCRELSIQNKLVIDAFNLSLEDYLVKIYVGSLPHKKRKKTNRIAIKLKPINTLIQKIKKKDVLFLLRNSKDGHEKILQQIDKIEGIGLQKELVYDCISNLVFLTKALAKFLDVDFNIEHSELIFLRTFWKHFWFSPGSIAEFMNQTDKSLRTGENMWYVCSLYRDSFDELIKFFEEELEHSGYFAINFPYLSNREIIHFRDIREKWKKCEYFDVAEYTTEILEEKIRVFLFNIFTLLYGKQENRLSRIDASSRTYILNNITKMQLKGFKVSRNEFEQLNRGNFKNFIIGSFDRNVGKTNWKEVFSHIFYPVSENKLKEFLSTFAEINIIVSHKKLGTISSENQTLILNYVLSSIDFIRKINCAYHNLLEKGFFIEDLDDHVDFRFSFNNLDDKAKLQPIIVSINNAKRVLDSLKRQGDNYILDLEDRVLIESYYSISYREFYAILSRLLHQTKPEMKQTGLKLEILRINGTSITFSLIRIKRSDYIKKDEKISWK